MAEDITVASVIVRRAFEVFAEDVAAPPPLTLRGANDVDSYSVARPYDAEQDAETDGYLEQFSFWGLTYLDARSWRHYLPRLIAYAFRRPEDPAMAVGALVRSLRPPDRYPPRLATLTPEQEAAIAAFLEHLAFGGSSPHLRDDAQQALEEWWLPNPRSRPTREDVVALRAVPVEWREVSRDLYRMRVPDTLGTSGEHDIPSESRRVETWGGYICGDVHMMVAVNITPLEVRSVAESADARATLFRGDVVAKPAHVRGARDARRLDGHTPGDSPAEPQALTIVVAAAGASVITLSVRTWARDDVDTVVATMVSSFEVLPPGAP